MGLWGKLFLEPGFKNFLFRYTQGRLFTNQIRAHFDQNEVSVCTFCLMQAPIANIAQMIIEEETVRHLFWECNNVRRVIEWIGQELIGGNFEETEFMLGKVRVNHRVITI